MHDLGGRDDRVCRKGHAVEIGDDALDNARGRALGGRDGGDAPVLMIAHLVERGDVHAADLRGPDEEIVLGPAFALRLPQQGQQLVVHLLPLAEDEEVDKRRHRLRVHRRGAARPHEGQQRLAVGRAQRKPRHVDHIEHGGVGHLIAHGEGQRVKGRERVAALERVERDPRLFHFLVHISPGGEGPLAPDEVKAVHGMVEDAHAEIGHADLIGVGETEGQPDIDLVLVLEDLPVFPAGIARRLLHPGQDAFQTFIHLKSPDVPQSCISRVSAF